MTKMLVSYTPHSGEWVTKRATKAHGRATDMSMKILVATVAIAGAAAGFTTTASAGDPVAGALIGGGIGAAIGNGPGAAVGAVIGSAIAASEPPYYERRAYYDAPPARYYDAPPARYYDAPPARYYEAPSYYEPAPRYYSSPAPVYYEPAPVYYAPRYYVPPVVVGLGLGWIAGRHTNGGGPHYYRGGHRRWR